MTKQEARKLALNKRKDFDIVSLSNEYVEKIIASDVLSKYEHIGIYYPLKYEINLLELIKHYKNKSFYLPKTRDILEFSKYDLNDTLIDGPFKTKEPVGDNINVNKMDCVIIPCVAISKDKRRIGYGKAYYDKTLACYKGYKIGICFKEFVGLEIEVEQYDLIMDMVII